MASEDDPNPMAESGVTMRSDSEQYSNGEDVSVSPPSSSSPAIVLYQPPTFWSLLRGAAINLFLPFVNGMMLGFGELFAHEAAFRLGWSGTRVSRAPSRPCERITEYVAGLSSIQTTSTPDRPRRRGGRQAQAEDSTGRSDQPRVSATRLKETGRPMLKERYADGIITATRANGATNFSGP